MNVNKPGAIDGKQPHVWFVNHHAVIPAKDGSSGRHLNLARYLPDHGWSASLIIASTIHSNGSQGMKGARIRRISSEDGISVLWVRASAYGRSTLRRLVGMFTFTANLLIPGMTRGLEAPNVIVGSTVHPLAAWAAMRLARRYRVPFVYEIRDVWPDALIHLGSLSRSSPIAFLMERISVRLARRAQLVVSPLPSIDEYLKEHGIDSGKFRWVSNGFDGRPEDPEPELPEGHPFTFMYLGAHGNANALDGIMEAFDTACKLLPDKSMTLRFVGSGPLKPQLIEFAKGLGSSGKIAFEERIAQADVIAREREADCLVANLHDSPVYNYGISPNKLFSYLYSHRPVIFACSAPNNPIRDAGAGIVVAGDDRPALAQAMVDMVALPIGERREMARKGYSHVLENYSHEVLAKKFADALDVVLVESLARIHS